MSLFTYYDEAETEIFEPVFNGNYGISDEHRAKISVALTGKKQSPKTIAKRAISNTGKKRTKEFSKLQSKHKKNVGVGILWSTPYGVFETSTLAAQAEGVDPSTIRYRCKSKNFPNYFQKSVK